MQPSFTPRQSHRTYNGTGTDNKVVVARALKAHNPNVKVYFYQPADRLGDTVYVQNVLKSHPGVLQDHMKILTRTHCTHLGIISYSLTGTLLECINTHTHTHTHTHAHAHTHMYQRAHEQTQTQNGGCGTTTGTSYGSVGRMGDHKSIHLSLPLKTFSPTSPFRCFMSLVKPNGCWMESW